MTLTFTTKSIERVGRRRFPTTKPNSRSAA